jgi:hypothetical protein
MKIELISASFIIVFDQSLHLNHLFYLLVFLNFILNHPLLFLCIILYECMLPIGTLSNLVMMTLNHMSVELKCRPEFGQLKLDYQIHYVFGVSQVQFFLLVLKTYVFQCFQNLPRFFIDFLIGFLIHRALEEKPNTVAKVKTCGRG